jgi:zinc/manganese transport system substrate-binding protein
MKYILMVLMVLCGGNADAAIKVVTSLPDLADLARQIGGEKVVVESIVRGDQNPHVIEVKPSYMMRLKSADLFLMIGMDLELWAPQIIDGSRNSALEVIDLSRRIGKLEIPASLSASEGDVHRYGNPHYWLDPRNIRVMVEDIVAALSRKSPADQQLFQTNGETYLKKLQTRIRHWEEVMKPFAGSTIITFHKSWTYFAAWLGLTVADQVEPKPGIAPSPSHTAKLISLVRQSGIRVIVVEPFYDASAAEQIARTTQAKVLRLPTSCGATEGVTGYMELMDYTIATLAGALK